MHVCTSRDFSGREEYAIRLATEQRHRGLNLTFAVGSGSALEKVCRDLGFEVIIVKTRAFWGRERFWIQLRKFIKSRSHLTVIHLHSISDLPAIFGAVGFSSFRKREGAKVILQTHEWLKTSRRDLLQSLIFMSVDEVWCSSEPARKVLLENLPISTEKLKVIRYGRDIAAHDSLILPRNIARQRLLVPESATVIGTISQVEKTKGVKEFLEASLTACRKDKNLHVVVIGGPDATDRESKVYYERLTRWCEKLDVRDQYHMVGPMPEAQTYLNAFDMYVLPSYLECFALSLIDAQISSLPIIATKSGGNTEVVKPGATGWLFEPENTLDLQRTLAQALSQKSNWKIYGAAAREKACRQFDQGKLTDEILSEYQA